MEGQEQSAVADVQLQPVGLSAQLHREQQPVRVPRPELETNGEALHDGRERSCRQGQGAAAGA